MPSAKRPLVRGDSTTGVVSRMLSTKTSNGAGSATFTGSSTPLLANRTSAADPSGIVAKMGSQKTTQCRDIAVAQRPIDDFKALEHGNPTPSTDEPRPIQKAQIIEDRRTCVRLSQMSNYSLGVSRIDANGLQGEVNGSSGGFARICS